MLRPETNGGYSSPVCHVVELSCTGSRILGDHALVRCCVNCTRRTSTTARSDYMQVRIRSPKRLELSFLTVFAFPKASNTVLLLRSTSSICFAAAAAVMAGAEERQRPASRTRKPHFNPQCMRGDLQYVERVTERTRDQEGMLRLRAYARLDNYSSLSLRSLLVNQIPELQHSLRSSRMLPAIERCLSVSSAPPSNARCPTYTILTCAAAAAVSIAEGSARFRGWTTGRGRPGQSPARRDEKPHDVLGSLCLSGTRLSRDKDGLVAAADAAVYFPPACFGHVPGRFVSQAGGELG